MNGIIIVIVMIVAALILPIGASAQRPVIPAVQVTEIPNIDGDLTDPCWEKAPKVQDFFVAANGLKPVEQTEAWICYDQKNMYVAFQCSDSLPDKIVARESKHGGPGIEGDDVVEVDFDCYGDCDGRKIIWLGSSARGTQYERLQSGEVSKIEWRGDWTVAAKRTPLGYNVEIAVPWSILNYDPKRTNMGVMFARKHNRTGGVWWGAPNCGTDWDPKKYYIWEGLKLPDYKKKPLYLGYSCLTSGQSNAQGIAGMDIKHSFTPRLTGVLSVNPDFRNVEQQVENVDFSYTEKYQTDNRPYFEEGSMYFPDSSTLYTRRIDRVDYGGKFMGTLGDYGIGAMHARGTNGELYDIARFSRIWAGQGHIELSAVNCSAPGSNNLAMTLAGDYLLYEKGGRKIQFLPTMAMADSALGGTKGHMYDFGLRSNGPSGSTNWNLGRGATDNNFQPAIGYVPEVGITKWYANGIYHVDPAKGPIKQWNAYLGTTLVDRASGGMFHNDLSAWVNCTWRKDIAASITWNGGPRSEDNGLSYHDSTLALWYVWQQLNTSKLGKIGYVFGKLGGGDYFSLYLMQNWPCTSRLTISGACGLSRISGNTSYAYHAEQLIGGLTYDLNSERSVSGRLVTQSGKSNLYVAYRQRVRAGLDAYLLFGDPNADLTKNVVTLKLIRPLF